VDVVRPTEIALGVASFAARTPTLLPATHTQSYALGTREVVLVEPATPYEDERREWLEWARGLASAGRELRAIFATHHHADHVGGAAFFAKELDLPLWAHAETAKLRPDVPVARTLADGDAIALDGPAPSSWDVLHTPGHARDHLCLHDRARRILVVGDMVASVGTILIEPEGGDMATYLAELERLAGLGAALALPAHGAPIPDPSALFRFYVAHRLARETKIAGALDALGAGDLDELVARAYDDVAPAVWPIAKLSLEAHLVKLAKDGRATRTEAGWRSLGPNSSS